MKVLQALEQVGVLPTIGAHHGDLLRLGLGWEDGHFKLERLQGHRLQDILRVDVFIGYVHVFRFPCYQ